MPILVALLGNAFTSEVAFFAAGVAICFVAMKVIAVLSKVFA